MWSSENLYIIRDMVQERNLLARCNGNSKLWQKTISLRPEYSLASHIMCKPCLWPYHTRLASLTWFHSSDGLDLVNPLLGDGNLPFHMCPLTSAMLPSLVSLLSSSKSMDQINLVCFFVCLFLVWVFGWLAFDYQQPASSNSALNWCKHHAQW